MSLNLIFNTALFLSLQSAQIEHVSSCTKSWVQEWTNAPLSQKEKAIWAGFLGVALLAHYPSSLDCEKGSGGWPWNKLQGYLEEGRGQCSFKPSKCSGNAACLLWDWLAREGCTRRPQCRRAAWWWLCRRAEHPQGLPGSSTVPAPQLHCWLESYQPARPKN